MKEKIEVMISAETIREKVKEIADKINRDYEGKTEELLIIGLLRGSIIFMADLIREIKVPVKIDFMTVSSYGSETTSSREVKIKKDLDENIMDKDVIVVEDIIDSGLTLNKVLAILQSRDPKSLKMCTLLNKPSRREVEVKIDYNGFDIPDEFVVGYGLDVAQKYRNLPFVGRVKGD